MSVLCVGSVALDSVETPFGKAEKVLGGSAVYFGAAATHFSPVQLVGVVGDGYPLDRLRFLKERDADLSGIEQRQDRTALLAPHTSAHQARAAPQRDARRQGPSRCRCHAYTDPGERAGTSCDSDPVQVLERPTALGEQRLSPRDQQRFRPTSHPFGANRYLTVPDQADAYNGTRCVHRQDAHRSAVP